MTPDNMSAPRSAIDWLIHDLLAPDDELSKQYALNHVSPGHKGGRDIRVPVTGRRLNVRARRGCVAS